jgi:transcriptional regulator with XRE-family HTH domain
MTFAEKLDKLIEMRGTSQSKLARIVGIHQQAISAMTRGKQEPYLRQGLALAKALEVPLEYLADDAIDSLPPAVLAERERMVWEIVRDIGVDEAWRRLIAADLGSIRKTVFPLGDDKESKSEPES